ncbi:hypothetical protein SAMN04487905_104152 [Actinopolyspora xinjiangensis]|uniref:Uncharacterized protein n=1 Tax=Actinopolyspora xinjiangensis TaxID=405564 RepID=A0A1H0SUA9_9ACTN|nr:hypothetical protein SAMN04487905_104152 [Actinopolyspora xinjiangensis]
MARRAASAPERRNSPGPGLSAPESGRPETSRALGELGAPLPRRAPRRVGARGRLPPEGTPSRIARAVRVGRTPMTFVSGTVTGETHRKTTPCRRGPGAIRSAPPENHPWRDRSREAVRANPPPRVSDSADTATPNSPLGLTLPHRLSTSTGNAGTAWGPQKPFDVISPNRSGTSTAGLRAELRRGIIHLGGGYRHDKGPRRSERTPPTRRAHTLATHVEFERLPANRVTVGEAPRRASRDDWFTRDSTSGCDVRAGRYLEVA